MARAQGSDNGGCQRKRTFKTYAEVIRPEAFDELSRLDEDRRRRGRPPLLDRVGPDDREARLYLGRDLLKSLTLWERMQAPLLVTLWHMAEHGDIPRQIRIPAPENHRMARHARDRALADRVAAHRAKGRTREAAIEAVAGENRAAAEPIERKVEVLRRDLKAAMAPANRAMIAAELKRQEADLDRVPPRGEAAIKHALKRDARRRREEEAFNRKLDADLAEMRAEAERMRLEAEDLSG